MTPKLQQLNDAMVKIDHLNIGIIILAVIAFIGITVIFLANSKKILSKVSGSLKDPVSGNWSGKIISAFMVSALIFIAHIFWLKSSFITNDFSKLENVLIIDYTYLTAVYGLRTVEKWQDAKKEENKQ